MKFFITYSDRDRAYAQEVINILKENDIRYFLDKKKFGANHKIKPQLKTELNDNCSHFLLILSSATSKASWIKTYIETASNLNKIIVPLKKQADIADCKQLPEGTKHLSNLGAFTNYIDEQNNRTLDIDISYSLSCGVIEKIDGVDTLIKLYDLPTERIGNYYDIPPILNITLKNKSQQIIQLKHPQVYFVNNENRPYVSDMIFQSKKTAIDYDKYIFVASSELKGQIEVNDTTTYRIAGNSMFSFMNQLKSGNLKAIKFIDNDNRTYKLDTFDEIQALINQFYSPHHLVDLISNHYL